MVWCNSITIFLIIIQLAQISTPMLCSRFRMRFCVQLFKKTTRMVPKTAFPFHGLGYYPRQSSRERCSRLQLENLLLLLSATISGQWCTVQSTYVLLTSRCTIKGSLFLNIISERIGPRLELREDLGRDQLWTVSVYPDAPQDSGPQFVEWHV